MTPPRPYADRLALELGLFDEDAARDPAPRGTRRAVLVVDDDPDMRCYLQDCLEPAYYVVTAPGGAAALRLAHAHRPDVVVSDVRMPGLDGFALCLRLKAEAALGHVPVLLISGDAADEVPEQARAAGADALLVKPFNGQDLRDAVHRLAPGRP